MSTGSKKYTRDVSEVTAVFMGSKKCTRDVNEVAAVFMGSKNVSAIVLVNLCVCGFKKIYPRCSWLLFEFAGSKKCTHNSVGCSLCLRVQKKCTRGQS